MTILDIVLSFVVGLAAGAVYFGGLWLTVRWVVDSHWAPVWLLVSAAARLLFLVAVLYWVMDSDVAKLFAALAGILVVRFAATWTARSGSDRPRRRGGEAATREAVDAADSR